MFNALNNEMIYIKKGDQIFSKKKNNISEIISEILSKWDEFDCSNNIELHYKYGIYYTEKWKGELKSMSLYPDE